MNLFFRRSACAALFAAPVFLLGCASPQPVSLNVDPAVVKLSEAADEISHSYRMLSYAESAQVSESGAGQDMDYNLEDFPIAWQQQYVLDDDFYGELEPFLRGISRLAGYDEPQVIGRRPVVPVTVTVNRNKRALAEFLIDVSYQAGGRALVILDPDQNRLQITYPQ